MEEKLFMKRGEKGLNVTSDQNGRLKQKNPGLRNGTEVCSLAHLAGSLVLPFFVGMGCGLRDKNNKQQRQTEGKQSSQTSPRV